MLPSTFTNKKGETYLNSLRRYVMSGLMATYQDLLIARIPAALGVTPGRSLPVPIQAPQDAKTEIYSLTGFGDTLSNIGIGTITTTGADVNVVGVGTKFLNQLRVGDVIKTANGTGTVATITSDTTLTTLANMAANTAQAFAYTITTSLAIQQQVFVNIEDQANRRNLMNRDCPVAHVFGSAQKPLFLKESLLLEDDQTALVTFYNYSTSGPAAFMSIAEGRKWQKEALTHPEIEAFIVGLRQRKQYVQPYWLTLDNGWATIPAGGSSINFFTVTGDLTTVLFNLYGYAVSTGVAGDIVNKVSLEFFDAKTQRQLGIQPVPLGAICGTAQNPMPLPVPLTCEPQTQIQVRITNLVTDQPTTVYLTFHGVGVLTGSNWRGGALNEPEIVKASEQMYKNTSKIQVRPASPQ